jgi:hypothetical protein
METEIYIQYTRKVLTGLFMSITFFLYKVEPSNMRKEAVLNFLSEARWYKLNPTSFSRYSTAMDTQQSQTGKNFKTDSNRAAVEFWRAGVALATIRKQLKMSESTLRRILAVARNNPTLPIPPRKPVSGRPRKISQEVIDRDGGMTKY